MFAPELCLESLILVSMRAEKAQHFPGPHLTHAGASTKCPWDFPFTACHFHPILRAESCSRLAAAGVWVGRIRISWQEDELLLLRRGKASHPSPHPGVTPHQPGISFPCTKNESNLEHKIFNESKSAMVQTLPCETFLIQASKALQTSLTKSSADFSP